MSRALNETPMTAPAASCSGDMDSDTARSEPSLRRWTVSKCPTRSPADTWSIASTTPARCSEGRSRPAGWPSISSAAYPNMSSAAWFQLAIRPVAPQV